MHLLLIPIAFTWLFGALLAIHLARLAAAPEPSHSADDLWRDHVA